MSLHFHNRQISTGGKCGAFRIDVTYSYSDIALCKLGADALDECIIIDQIDTIDSDQKPFCRAFSESRSSIPSMNCMSSSASSGRGIDARTG